MARKTAAFVSPSHFQVMPVGFPRRVTAVRSRQSGDKKKKSRKGGWWWVGENVAAEDYHFYIKRMLSQQSG